MAFSAVPSRRERDMWADAVCRQSRFAAWAVEHRASFWDFQIDDEERMEKRARLEEAKRLCSGCPLQLQCLRFHDALVAETRERVPGVWGGVVFSDRESRVGARRKKREPVAA